MADIAPWIKPAEPAAYWQPAYSGASQTSLAQSRMAQEAADMAAQIQMRQQALAQDAAQAEMAAEIQRKRIENEARVDQHRLAIDAEYKRIQAGLEFGRLQEAQRANELKWQDAARQFQEQQGFIQDQKAGMSFAEAASRHPGMYSSGGWLPGMARARAEEQFAQLPPKEVLVGDTKLIQTGPNRYIQPKTPPKDDMMESSIGVVQRSIENLKAKLPEVTNKKMKKAMTETIEEQERFINDKFQAMGREPYYPDVSDKVYPLPKRGEESKLVVGRVYETKRGKGKWNGKVFIPVTE